MRICSFGNPRICITRRVAHAGNTHGLDALTAFLNLHIDTPPRCSDATEIQGAVAQAAVAHFCADWSHQPKWR